MRRIVSSAVACAAFLFAATAPAGSQSAELSREQRFEAFLTLEERVSGVVSEPRWIVDGGVERALRFRLDGRTFELSLADGALREAPAADPQDERLQPLPPRYPGSSAGARELLSPDERFVLTGHDDNVQLRSVADGSLRSVTRDGRPDNGWYLVDYDGWSHAVWAPDSRHAAVFREDLRSMARLPVVHYREVTERVDWMPYVKAGGVWPDSSIHVLDVTTGRHVAVDPGGSGDDLLFIHRFSPDSRQLYFQRADRNFKSVELRVADTATGASRRLLVERQPTFVKSLSLPPFVGDLFTALPERRQFLWISERDGWDHLYLYEMPPPSAPPGEGARLVRRLTTGVWPVVGVAAVDENAGWVYFLANAEERPYDTHLYRVGIAGGAPRRLTAGAGLHAVDFSPSRELFVDTWSSPWEPTTVELRTADGRLVRKLSQASADELVKIGWQPPEPFVVRAADGKTPIHGLLLKPADFDPQRRYPVIEHLYGGPYRTHVPRTFLARGAGKSLARALTQLGFAVVVVDGRGTPERGKAFQDVVYRSFGQHEIADHAGALRQLAAERPWMDLGRVGVYGMSWGGYMTLRAMLLEPDLYRVGIATNGVYDLYDHGAIALEGYMDLLPRNPEGYEAASSLRLVDRLQGKLLIVHGSADVNATLSASMKLADALIRADKPFDMLIVPEMTHAIRGQHRGYWWQASRRYFEEHLKP